MATKKKENTKIDAAKDSRRGFLRAAAAAVGVAGVALTAGKAAASSKTEAPMRKAGGTQQLTAVEQAKDLKLQDAAKLLKDIDANIEIVWVKRKGNTPATRRIIQMVG